MAGNKDKSVVAVISGLTDTQAANINRDIMKAKRKHAPNSRGTSAIGRSMDVSRMLDRGFKRIGGK